MSYLWPFAVARHLDLRVEYLESIKWRSPLSDLLPLSPTSLAARLRRSTKGAEAESNALVLVSRILASPVLANFVEGEEKYAKMTKEELGRPGESELRHFARLTTCIMRLAAITGTMQLVRHLRLLTEV